MKNLFLSMLMVFAVTVAMADQKENKNTAEAQTTVSSAMLSGSVTDQNTNESLVGVKIELEGTEQVTYTDFDGNYRFENVKPGTYAVTASYVSYDKTSLKKVVVNPSENQVMISLKSSN